MRFSRGKHAAARTPCHTRGRSMKRSDPRGSQRKLAGNRDASNTTARPSGAAVAGHKTSVSLEDPFWEGLKEIAKAKRQSLSELVGGIDTDREHGNLSSALRLFVLDHYQKHGASGMVVDNSVRAAEYTNVHDTDDWPNERRL